MLSSGTLPMLLVHFWSKNCSRRKAERCRNMRFAMICASPSLSTTHFECDLLKHQGLADQPSALCSLNSAYAPSMLVAECSRCTPSERPPGHTMCSIQLTFSPLSSKDLLHCRPSLQ